MAITRADKEKMLQSVKDALAGSKSMVFVNFHGLSVAQATEVRRNLRANDIGYFVAKKRIIKLALEGSGITGTIPELEGELAIAYSADLASPAREIFLAQKKFDKRISIQGGIFDGVYKNKEEMLAIATIPSREVLYGMFVNLINSPIQRLVIVMDQIAKTKTA